MPQVSKAVNHVYESVMLTWPISSGYSISRILPYVNGLEGGVGIEGSEPLAYVVEDVERGTTHRPTNRPPWIRSNRKFPHFPRAYYLLALAFSYRPQRFVGEDEEVDTGYYGEMTEADYYEAYYGSDYKTSMWSDDGAEDWEF